MKHFIATVIGIGFVTGIVIFALLIPKERKYRPHFSPLASEEYQTMSIFSKLSMMRRNSPSLKTLLEAGWQVTVSKIVESEDPALSMSLELDNALLTDCQFHGPKLSQLSCMGISFFEQNGERMFYDVAMIIPSVSQRKALPSLNKIYQSFMSPEVNEKYSSMSLKDKVRLIAGSQAGLMSLVDAGWQIGVNDFWENDFQYELNFELAEEQGQLSNCNFVFSELVPMSCTCSEFKWHTGNGPVNMPVQIDNTHAKSASSPWEDDLKMLMSAETKTAFESFGLSKRLDFASQKHGDFLALLKTGWEVAITEVKIVDGRLKPTIELASAEGRLRGCEFAQIEEEVGCNCTGILITQTTEPATSLETPLIVPSMNRMDFDLAWEEKGLAYLNEAAKARYANFDFSDRAEFLAHYYMDLTKLQEGGWHTTVENFSGDGQWPKPQISLVREDARLESCFFNQTDEQQVCDCGTFYFKGSFAGMDSAKPIRLNIPVRVVPDRPKSPTTPITYDFATFIEEGVIGEFEALSPVQRIAIAGVAMPSLSTLTEAGWTAIISRFGNGETGPAMEWRLKSGDALLQRCHFKNLVEPGPCECSEIQVLGREGLSKQIYTLPMLIRDMEIQAVSSPAEGVLTNIMVDNVLQEYGQLSLGRRLEFVARQQPRFSKLADGGWSSLIIGLIATTPMVEPLSSLSLGETELSDCQFANNGETTGCDCKGVEHEIQGGRGRRKQDVAVQVPQLDKPFASSGKKVEVKLADNNEVKASGMLLIEPDGVRITQSKFLVPDFQNPGVVNDFETPPFSLNKSSRVVALKNWPIKWTLPVPEVMRPLMGGQEVFEVFRLDTSVSVDFSQISPSYILDGDGSLFGQNFVRLRLDYSSRYTAFTAVKLSFPTPLPGVCFNLHNASVELDFAEKSIRLLGTLQLGSRGDLECLRGSAGPGLISKGVRRMLSKVAERFNGQTMDFAAHLYLDLDEPAFCGKLALFNYNVLNAAYSGEIDTYSIMSPVLWEMEGLDFSSMGGLARKLIWDDYNFPTANIRSCWNGDEGPFSQRSSAQ